MYIFALKKIWAALVQVLENGLSRSLCTMEVKRISKKAVNVHGQ